ncbi:uncharacterized protein LOC110812623 [Carica papaya]|uniref:uncharacterized protein LOC110812623 n=1 Tax=Carica papaya TaxID=3649 RepID=UPI000B8C986A|nr:uncharacterized protein LOC110812623 [Carica papaya]
MARGCDSSNPQLDSSTFHNPQAGQVAMSDEIHNPFFLHSNDHPGLILATHVLNGNNYNTWERAMRIALNTKNKLGFIDGSVPQPDSTDSMVISWLLNAVAKDIADSLFYLENAQAIWSDLQRRFQQSNAPKIFQLKKSMNTFTQGSLTVNAYYTIMKTMWDELKTYQPAPVCHCGGMRAWKDY